MIEETMNGFSWIPQVKSNTTWIESTNRMKTRLLAKLKLKYISTKEDDFKRMVLYLRRLGPDSLNIGYEW